MRQARVTFSFQLLRPHLCASGTAGRPLWIMQSQTAALAPSFSWLHTAPASSLLLSQSLRFGFGGGAARDLTNRPSRTRFAARPISDVERPLLTAGRHATQSRRTLSRKNWAIYSPGCAAPFRQISLMSLSMISATPPDVLKTPFPSAPAAAPNHKLALPATEIPSRLHASAAR